MRGSRVVFAEGGRRERPTSREPMSRRNDYVPMALVRRSMKSIIERFQARRRKRDRCVLTGLIVTGFNPRGIENNRIMRLSS